MKTLLFLAAPNPYSRPARLNRRLAAAVALFALLCLAACRHDTKFANPDVDYYTCTMHPSVRSQDPNGKCPICSMDLVPVFKKGVVKSGNNSSREAKRTNEFSVPVERQQQIGVTYATVERKRLLRTIRSFGTVAPDRSRQRHFVARVEGYVQAIFVASPGEAVSEGQPLLAIYSPDVTAKQLAELDKSRKSSRTLTLYSPFKGVVQDLPVEQGGYVKPGDPLVTVADLSMVWVWAEFYEDEFPMIAKGQKVRLSAKSYPDETFEGEISLIDPFLTETKRTVRARIDMPNPDSKLRSGMYMNIQFGIDAGEGLAVPVSAIMPTGERNVVFVDKGEGKIEPRVVQLGGKFGEFYKIKSGLAEGERVVASANFLIDAESKVQGALKDFEEPETTPAGEKQ